MITDQDIEKLKQVFATKEDINRFATIDDLDRFATKEDLDRFATKDDLIEIKTEMRTMEKRIRHDMATKDDLYSMETRIRRDMATDIEQALEKQTTSLMTGINDILNLIAETSEGTKNNTKHFQSHQITLGDHERRLKKLESTTATG